VFINHIKLKILELWNFFSMIGAVNLQLSKKEIRRIKLLNRFTAVFIFVVLLSFCFQFVEYQLIKNVFNINSYLMLVVHLPVAGVFILHYYKRYFAAKILFIFILIFTQGGSALILGQEFGIHYYLLLLIILFVVLFDDNKHILIFSVVTVLSFFAIQVGFDYVEPVLSENIKPSTKYLVFPILVILFIILLFIYRQEIAVTENKLISKYNNQLKTLMHVASHDLKENIRTLGSYSNLLKKDAQIINSTNAKEYLGYIEAASKRMGHLLDDLISYSLADASEIEMSEIDLNTVLNEVVSILEIRIKKSNASINIAKLPIVIGQHSQLVQLFQNLIANSIKFTNCNIQPKISISYLTSNKHLVVAIKDNGIGIDEKYFDKVFNPFYRLNNKEVYEGSGLGLSICKKIARLHEMTIKVESSPGEGSIFKLLFKKI